MNIWIVKSLSLLLPFMINLEACMDTSETIFQTINITAMCNQSWYYELTNQNLDSDISYCHEVMFQKLSSDNDTMYYLSAVSLEGPGFWQTNSNTMNIKINDTNMGTSLDFMGGQGDFWFLAIDYDKYYVMYNCDLKDSEKDKVWVYSRNISGLQANDVLSINDELQINGFGNLTDDLQYVNRNRCKNISSITLGINTTYIDDR